MRCEADNPVRGRCPNDAATTVTVACVHEHIGERLACTTHLERVQNDRVACQQCRYCSDPHLCFLHLGSVVPLAAANVPARSVNATTGDPS